MEKYSQKCKNKGQRACTVGTLLALHSAYQFLLFYIPYGTVSTFMSNS